MEANRGIRSGGNTTSGDQKTNTGHHTAHQQATSTANGSPAKAVATAPPSASPTSQMVRPPAALAELKGHIALLDGDVFTDWSLGDALAGLETLETIKRMIEARQALITTHIVQIRCQAAEKAERSTRNIPAEVGKDLGLVRKLNGSRARQVVDLACECPDQAPLTFALWLDGKVSEDQALTLFKHTSLLTPAGRFEADDNLAEDLPNLGIRELRKRLDDVVTQLEPELVAERRRKAAANRRAGFTYRPDGMMNLNALLPGVAGQAMETILSTYARSKRHRSDEHEGDERTQDQLKADLLTALVIGWAKATKGVPDEFLRAHHIGCGGEPGQPCTQAQAQAHSDSGKGKAPSDGHADGDCPLHHRKPAGHQTEPEEAAAKSGNNSGGESATCQCGAALDDPGELCTPTTGFTDVETVGGLFSHLVPTDDGMPATHGRPAAETGDHGAATEHGIPAGMEFDSTLGLLLPAGVGVHVNLVMTDLSAFGITDQPAQIFGLGPYPAEMAREVIHTAHTRHSATLRRLYTDPASGALMRMESTARTFPDGLGKMIALRDGHCRFPFCDAPIRHLDHIQPHAEGGPTSYSNGQGLCARHNLLKEGNHASTHPEPSTPGDIRLYGQDSSAVAGRDIGCGGGVSDVEIGAQAARDADAGSPSGQRYGEILGGGAVITVLSTGMKFTSPTRAFPSESPMSVAEDHYWRGYREGRGDQRQQLVDREHDLQRQEDVIFAAEDHLKRIADVLLDNGAA
ncbi:HNH endonuclease signature motif containing protein [Galactobacter sp.]|uniref:HNH endonuclease signature motif containing protein n=1 Tax=Galactobacter sp. TaxID=2676125 RepID=UPI0025C6CA1C|nr:HNH endonuclease signature motif containing protein [Galactobacter sp.]